MLEPDYIQKIADGAVQIAEELHDEILQRIVERIRMRVEKGEEPMSALDRWQIQSIQEAGYLMEDIAADIAKYTPLEYREIGKAMADAGVKSMEWDDDLFRSVGLTPSRQSPYYIRLMERGYNVTKGEWQNFTKSLLSSCNARYQQVMDKAYHMTTSGAVSFQQAYEEAIDELAQDGVYVTYPSGHRETIEVAAARALRTSISQTCGEITTARMDEVGWDIILVSSHLGARYGDGGEDYTNHSWWQGKFYSKSGKDKSLPPFSDCGMGNIQGLCGVNCRHSYGPGDGVHNPFKDYDSEENRRVYDLTQEQRAYERKIRKAKRDVAVWEAAGDEYKERLSLAKAKLRQVNKDYREFCEENDLNPQPSRTRIGS